VRVGIQNSLIGLEQQHNHWRCKETLKEGDLREDPEQDTGRHQEERK
jgi:hypothetical protein